MRSTKVFLMANTVEAILRRPAVKNCVWSKKWALRRSMGTKMEGGALLSLSLSLSLSPLSLSLPLSFSPSSLWMDLTYFPPTQYYNTKQTKYRGRKSGKRDAGPISTGHSKSPRIGSMFLHRLGISPQFLVWNSCTHTIAEALFMWPCGRNSADKREHIFPHFRSICHQPTTMCACSHRPTILNMGRCRCSINPSISSQPL